MHDGSINTIEEVIDHYARGGRLIDIEEFKSDGKENLNKSGFVKGFDITTVKSKILLSS